MLGYEEFSGGESEEGDKLNLSKKFKSYLPKLIKICYECSENHGPIRKVEEELEDWDYKYSDVSLEGNLAFICKSCEGDEPSVAEYIQMEYNEHLL